MTPLGWGALGAVALAAGPGASWRVRTLRLSATGRLAAPLPARQWPGRRLAIAGARGAGGLLVAGVWIAGGAVLAAALGIALAASDRLIAAARRRLDGRRADARHGAALHLLVAELRAGSRLAQALRAAAEVDPHPAWERSARAAAAGADPVETLTASATTAGVGHACRVAARSGAPLADVLGRLAADHADGMDQRRAVRAALAGAHASAAVLAVLPVVGLALGAAMGAHPLATLLHTGAGHLVCLLGVTLDAAGLVWTARIVSSAARS